LFLTEHPNGEPREQPPPQKQGRRDTIIVKTKYRRNLNTKMKKHIIKQRE